MARWDDDLLRDLNVICDMVIGNESPTDVAFNERSTLPERLAHVQMYPTSPSAIKDAVDSINKLSKLVDNLSKKIKLLEYKNKLKLRKY
jgi:hypothetical protein